MQQPEIKMNPYALPGISAERYGWDEINALLEMAECYYRLPPGTMRATRNGMVIKKYEKVSLSEIRKAIALLVHQQTSLAKKEVARIFNIDHSSHLKMVETAINHYEKKDEVFMSYYNSIRLLATGARIRDLPSLTA